MTSNTKFFNTMTELAEFAQTNNRATAGPAGWVGGTLQECVSKTLNGDLGLVAKSDEFLAKFETLTFVTLRRQWRNDVAGHVPHVPSFIAGHPNSMRRRTKQQYEAAPVTILVDVGVSAAFSHNDILARGAAILALCRVLAGYRAVSLYVMDASKLRTGRQSAVVVRIDTTPLDLAHAAWALCGTGFLRQIMLPMQIQRLGTSAIPVFRGSLGGFMLELLPEGTCVLEVPGTSSDITRDPAGWIEARLREAAPEVLGEAA